MNCPHCRKPVPARARYCVHCGAEQEATPIAAVAAAAMGSRGRREAANAAHAGAQPDGTTHAELRGRRQFDDRRARADRAQIGRAHV